MKITESRLKEIIREELSEQKYNSNIVKFFKSLYRPGDDRRRRILQRLGAKQEEKPEEEESAVPVTVQTDFPIQITTQEFAEFINKTNFAKVAKMFKKLGIDKDAAEIKKKLISLLPVLFHSFDKALIDSDVGDYFRLQGAVNETIDINKRIGVGSAPESNLIIFVFGGLLKNYINKQSKEVEAFGEIPPEKLDQLQNSVSGLTNKTLRNILSSKETGTATPTAPPEEEAPEPAPDTPADPAPQPEPATAVEDEDEEETEQIIPTIPLTPDEQRQIRQMNQAEGIDRKEQVIIERWQVISGINKKGT